MHLSSTLKTSENRKFFWCLQGVKKVCIGNQWVKASLPNASIIYLLKKKQKTFGLLVLSGGIKWKHWPEIV